MKIQEYWFIYKKDFYRFIKSFHHNIFLVYNEDWRRYGIRLCRLSQQFDSWRCVKSIICETPEKIDNSFNLHTIFFVIKHFEIYRLQWWQIWKITSKFFQRSKKNFLEIIWISAIVLKTRLAGVDWKNETHVNIVSRCKFANTI